jgi:hypothetical protein
VAATGVRIARACLPLGLRAQQHQRQQVKTRRPGRALFSIHQEHARRSDSRLNCVTSAGANFLDTLHHVAFWSPNINPSAHSFDDQLRLVSTWQAAEPALRQTFV